MLFDQAWQKTLMQGMDADLPGATARSIQAGFQNAPFNTLRSLPQYMGSPAGPVGPREVLQAQNLLQPQDRGTRTNVAPPMLNKGEQVSLAAPIYSLLGGGGQMPKRRRLSLI
jgi:hypothetical protein